MDSSCLQVHVRGNEWMPMLIRFLDQWGEYCMSDDVHKCYLMVVKEKTIFLKQVKEQKFYVSKIMCHHVWIEGENLHFLKVPSIKIIGSRKSKHLSENGLVSTFQNM